jgi:predicted nucleotide-binding protein
MLKPHIFIASSAEGIAIAEEIQLALHHTFEVQLWSQDLFTPSSNALDDLLAGLSEWDFGVFVLSPDDVVKLRNQEYSSVRDNVLFELGLAMGRLGRARALMVRPSDTKTLRIASDLAAILFT